MRTGFQLLETRYLEEPINILAIEKKYSMTLPPLLKLFLETFKVGKLSGHVLYFPNQEVGFDNFLPSIEDMIACSISPDEDEEFLEKKLIPIATSGIHSGGICVGMMGEFKDKIVLDTDYLDRFKVINDNIFEFVRGLKEYDPSKYVDPY